MKTISKILLPVIILLSTLFSAAAEELTLVSMNAWSAMDSKGFFTCEEWEAENDRSFRIEILTSGLSKLEADVIVLNSLNPLPSLADSIAAELGMNAESWISRSGLRLGPVSLPINLKEGDAILTAENLSAEPAGRLHMGGLLASGGVSLFSCDGVQIIGELITIGEMSIYLFSAVWTESLFDDEESLGGLLEGYLRGEFSADQFIEYSANAVEGSAIRRDQAAQTLSFVNSIAGANPVILMGSLNALPGSEELSLLIDAGFVDVYDSVGRGPGYTLDSTGNSSFERIPNTEPQAAFKKLSGRYRSDYILIRGAELIPRSAGIVLDKPVYGVYPSLRYGLKAVIELGPSPSE